MRCYWSLLFFLISYWANAQQYYSPDTQLHVDVDGKRLSMPFAGGINAAQVQTLDIDGDGEEEYVIWDINAGIVSVFSEGEEGFEHRPGASYHFPGDISGFLVLADYDGDGRKDLFTATPFGIKAYRNITAPGSEALQWEEAQPFLRLDNGSNVTANSLDIPLIMDLDGDGDLDIVTFNFATGDYLEYYQNTSMERKGARDIDGFAAARVRWGRFEFCGCGNISFGQTCSGRPIQALDLPAEALRTEHAGGHTMLYHDFTGDGVRDLLMGQDECSTLYFLPNKGTDSNPVFDEFLLELPQIGKLPEFPIFHAAYLVRDQLIISTHSSEVASSFGVDFASSVYQYPLSSMTGEPGTRRFFQEHMLDLGENARPFFDGNRSAGTLTVTANQLHEGRILGKASRFRLGGGQLTLEEEDYLSLSALELRELSYQEFQAASGIRFVVITGDETVNSIPEKNILWKPLANLTEPFKASRVPGFSLRGVDDLNFFSHGGEDYLLLARQTGELILFGVDFGESIDFELLERDFLGFSDNPVNRGLTVHVLPGNPPSLVAVDQRGVLRMINDFMNNPHPEPIHIQVGGQDLGDSRLGRNTWITAVPDPFEGQVDLVLGTRAGGVVYLRHLTEGGGGNGNRLQVKLYPNPAQTRTTILTNDHATVDLVHASGKVVHQGIDIRAHQETELNLLGLAPGLYILRVNSENMGRRHQKLLVRP